MKAIICTRYGPPEVLQLREVAKPVPGDHEVLIRIHATTAHIGDTKIRRLQPGMGPLKDIFIRLIIRVLIGFTGPRRKILGMDLAGEIEAVGKKVTLFKAGDQVFAGADMLKFGTYAEYICISETGAIALKPVNMSYQEAAPLCNGGTTASLILKKAHIQPGQKVLIYGASGSVGTYAVQIARHYGGVVTGVCSTANLDLVKSLGADRVLDYTSSDFTQDTQTYDVIFDAVGKMPGSQVKKSLRQGGVYLNVLTSSDGLILKTADLVVLKDLVEAGHLRTVIDRQYPLEQMVEAHRYVDAGHKKGNVVITVGHA